jgi:hypothetical protein
VFVHTWLITRPPSHLRSRRATGDEQRQQLSALEAQRRAAARAAEDALAGELARLDDRAKEQKLLQVEAAERAYEVGRPRRRELIDGKGPRVRVEAALG